MQPFATTKQKHLSRRWTLAAFFFTLVSVVLMLHQVMPRSFKSLEALRFSRHLTHSAQHEFHDAQSADGHVHAIPNIIHFVHFMLDTEETFDLRFREFLAIYSAHYYMQPEIIYIHTNVEAEEMDELLDSSTSPWTSAVRSLPTVKFNYHKLPKKTSKGLLIDHIAHKTDFTRIDVLEKYGGIYLDDDSYILRPLHQFLKTGFENVFGAQLGGEICPSAILSTKGNKFNKIFLKLMDLEFDGSWTKHSVHLMTTMTPDFHHQPHQILRLPQQTFFPYSWEDDDLKTIYLVHDRHESNNSIILNHPTTNTTDFIEHFQNYPASDTWQVDWRLSYILHGWNHIAQDRKDQLFGKYGEISLEYVLEQSSNFARAVGPAVWHALDSGVLDHVGIEGGKKNVTAGMVGGHKTEQRS